MVLFFIFFIGDDMRKLRLIIMILILLVPINVFGLSTTASSAILMDMDSGRVLYSKDIHNPRLVASITKIMTAVIAIENGNLEEVITVGEEVLTMYGSNIYIQLGEKMTLRDLLYGLLLRSGNDAAIVIGTHIGGSEERFVEMMNKKAKEIGMIDTTYSNCHGLDEVTKNYSTAYDMAILSSYANTLEEYRKISSTKKWTTATDGKSYEWFNRNKLLTRYKYATGGKTGYTPSAGRTLVTTASKDNLNLTAVTLNDPNEYISHENMYEYVFNKYKNYLIVDKENFYIDDNFYKGKIYVKKSFYYPLTEDELEQTKVVVELLKQNNYKDNDKVGEVIVTMDEQEIYRDSVFSKQKKEPKISFWNKIKDFFCRMF
jgi:D-alanyl-D-alanine carboxypeptidase